MHERSLFRVECDDIQLAFVISRRALPYRNISPYEVAAQLVPLSHERLEVVSWHIDLLFLISPTLNEGCNALQDITLRLHLSQFEVQEKFLWLSSVGEVVVIHQAGDFILFKCRYANFDER